MRRSRGVLSVQPSLAAGRHFTPDFRWCYLQIVEIFNVVHSIQLLLHVRAYLVVHNIQVRQGHEILCARSAIRLAQLVAKNLRFGCVSGIYKVTGAHLEGFKPFGAHESPNSSIAQLLFSRERTN